MELLETDLLAKTRTNGVNYGYNPGSLPFVLIEQHNISF